MTRNSTQHTETDYPAAHSMDTEWFAVDEDGHVARFDTGEDGALPDRAATGIGGVDPFFDMDEFDALRVARMLAAGTDPAGDWRPEPSAGRTLIVVDVESAALALDAAGQHVERDRLEVLSEQAPFLLLSSDALTLEQVEALREHESVRWTLDLRDTGELFATGEGDDGMYHFGRDHGEDPGLYTLQRAPEHPIRFDKLQRSRRAPGPKQTPASTQTARAGADAIGALRFPVRFSEIKQLHLADHLDESEVQTYGDLPLRYSNAGVEGDEDDELERRIAARERRAKGELGEAKLKLAILLLAFIGVVLWLWLRA